MDDSASPSTPQKRRRLVFRLKPTSPAEGEAVLPQHADKDPAAAEEEDDDDVEDAEEDLWESRGRNEEDDEDAEQSSDDGMVGQKQKAKGESSSRKQVRLSSALKDDHSSRPIWVCEDGRVILEAGGPLSRAATDFLIAVAEPLSRPALMHEYALTPHSLYAAASAGLSTEVILAALDRLSKNPVPPELKSFVRDSTEGYGKAKLVLRGGRFFIESRDADILKTLLKDKIIASAATAAAEANRNAANDPGQGTGGGAAVQLQSTPAPQLALPKEAAVGTVTDRERDQAVAMDTLAGKDGSSGQDVIVVDTDDAGGGVELTHSAADDDDGARMYSFEVKASAGEVVKARCLPSGLNMPLMEEYDFSNDKVNPDLAMDLKPVARLRPYQETALSKMFAGGRARSGTIVLPCGAGKSLTGVAAAARCRKSTLVLCTNSVSVDQWVLQFKLWSTIADTAVCRFIAESKETFEEPAGVLCTTYHMLAVSGARSAASEVVLQFIAEREWGLLILDEVHVAPADKFRTVLSTVKAHCKLGLSATLVREDALIEDLNFLIGPKLYEANWSDLAAAGHLARVQCAEVWCDMTPAFYAEYLRQGVGAARRRVLATMNPNKFLATSFLMRYHEAQRGDKVIVFSDDIFAIREYATKLRRPFIYGATPLAERTRILYLFKNDPAVSTIFLSKVGDNSIDIPEANVIIQISFHGGSRRQEAQRLGRILRAKPGSAGIPSDECNAFFYTLVSRDTVEMAHSTRRQQFLVDQGYAFKVIPSLPVHDQQPPPALADPEEQLELLSRVLAAADDDLGVDSVALEEDEAGGDGLTRGRKGRLAPAVRVQGSMRKLTGAQGMSYMEFDRHQDAQANAKSRSRHSLFKSRFK